MISIQTQTPGIGTLSIPWPVVGFIGFSVFVLLLALVRNAGATRRFPYALRDSLLTPAERSFYGALNLAIQQEFVVCPKVRLADLFFVTNGDISSLNRITSKHVDFALCDPTSLRPVLGIELDDSSHQARRRMERDEFVDGAFKAARLPLLRVPVRSSYNPSELKGLIQEALSRNVSAQKPEAERSEQKSGSLPSCPHCHIPMVVRTVKRGANPGSRFYGCANYPSCRQTAPVEG